MTRKDGLLALLVVVVWGLNFVVIKLIAQHAAADAGGPALYAGRLPGAAVCRPAGYPLRLLLGYGLTISFGQFAFCSALSAWACRRGWRRWCCRRKPFTIILGAFVFGERLQGKQLAGIALAIFGVLVLVEGSLAGACPTGGLYADPGGGASWPAAIFSTKIMSQATRPPIISLVVERIDPGAAVYVCLVVDRWPAAHAGESTPDRYADGSLAALPGVYRHPRRLWYLGLAAGALKPGGWRRCRCWCR